MQLRGYRYMKLSELLILIDIISSLFSRVNYMEKGNCMGGMAAAERLTDDTLHPQRNQTAMDNAGILPEFNGLPAETLARFEQHSDGIL
ncbi:hypothetical protein BN874_1140001 [Candidatus Contendobacter odensis Run_B_J11]|uniref:Uncharacterized protein n=2 Tax=Candidatus Contendibacter odensensis TaxID=1400860 RepID=A0A7U7G7J3_9GAMM|nr:hypothetical protein BN874_1140001 [Candidatus Contendobacter odensis Run_B_J11]